MKKEFTRFGKSLCFLLGIILLLFTIEARDVFASDETDSAEIIANGNCGYNGDNLTWTLDAEGQLTISGTGNMANYNDKTSRAPWYSYSSNLKSVIIENGVSSIGNYAFENCKSLESVKMTGDLKNIKEYAFRDCSKLTSVSFSEGLQSIGQYAFYRCNSLLSIKVPSTCTSIGLYAIAFCQKLESATILGNPSLDSGIFQNCNNLLSATVPYPANSVFYNCANLSNVTFTKTNYTSIGNSALKNCTSLTDFTIPQSVTYVYTSAFHGCTELNSISVDPDNQKYCSVDGIIYDKEKTKLILCPSGKAGAVSIPETVYYIEDYAFATCSKITEVQIPEDASYIGVGAFQNCSNLQKVNLPGRISSIEMTAFDKCTSLKTITIPANVKKILDYAFRGTGLQIIIVPETVTYISPSAFDNCINIEGIYYYGTEEAWSSLISGSNNQYLLEAPLHYLIITPGKAPTCTESGYTEGQKWYGEDTYIEGKEPEILNPTGHNWSSYKSDDNATCTENSTKTSTCVWCGKTDSIEEPDTKKEHSFDLEQWKSDNDTHWRKCKNCDARTDEESHTKNEKITPAIYNRYGTYYAYCSECERELSYYYIPAIKSIGISKNQFVYSGSNVSFTITVKDEKGDKISSKYYDISYPDGRKSVGKHKVKIKFKELYSGESYKEFTINPPTTSVTALTNVSNGIKISWKKVAVADSYIVYRAPNRLSWDSVGTVKGSSNTSFTDTSKLKNGKTYWYYVVPKKTVDGKGYWGAKGTDKNICRVSTPSAIKLNNSSAGKMTVTWSKSDVPTGYVIQYSLKSNFSAYSTVKFKNVKLIDSKVISKLKKGKTYYVRMYAYKIFDGKEINSGWSTKKTLKIKK